MLNIKIQNFMLKRLAKSLERKRRREYKRMFSRNMRKIKRIVKSKDFGPWDFCYGIDLFIAFLRFMEDFYSLGYNVWALDEDDNGKSRLGSLRATLEAYEEYRRYKYDSDVDEWKHERELELCHRVFSLLEDNLESWWD